MKFRGFLIEKKGWVYILAGLAVVILGLSSAYYYFYIYLKKPNFDEAGSIDVSSVTGKDVKPGEFIEYTVYYKNSGNVSVDDMDIEIEIPSNTAFAGSDHDQILKTENTGRVIDFEIGTVLKNADDKITFKVEVNKPLDNGTIIRLGEVQFHYRVKENVLDKKLSAEITNVVVSSPRIEDFELMVVDLNGGEVRMGDTLQYILRVENTGDMNAAGVAVNSSISEYGTVVPDSVSGRASFSKDGINWSFENLEINRPEKIYFQVKVKDDLTDDALLVNNSTVGFADVKLEKKVESRIVLYPDLTASEYFATDENGGYLWASEIINVKIVVKNTGEKKETSCRVVCPIPGGATYISNSGTPEGIKLSGDARGLSWDIKDLAAGEEKVLSFKMKVDESLANSGGSITTKFVINSSLGDIELDPKSLKVMGHVYLTVVAMGDSLIGRSNWVQTFDALLEANYPHADYNTIPSAVNGELSREGLARFDSTVAPLRPDIIILAYGTNDVGPIPSGFTSNIENLIVKSKNLGARVFINLLGPMFYPGKEGYPSYNNAIRTIAAKYGVTVIDVLTPLSADPGAYMSDTLHYSPEGANVVAHTVFSYVSRYLGDIGQRL